MVSEDLSFEKYNKFMYDVRNLPWDEPYLFQSYSVGLVWRCVPKVEMMRILDACHYSLVGGHHSNVRKMHKML